MIELNILLPSNNRLESSLVAEENYEDSKTHIFRENQISIDEFNRGRKKTKEQNRLNCYSNYCKLPMTGMVFTI